MLDVQEVQDQSWFFEMTVNVIALQGLSAEAEESDCCRHNCAPHEAQFHYGIGEPRDLPCEVESVDSEAQEWSYDCRAYG